jgi:hypothetical protein
MPATETAPIVFGGTWKKVHVERVERVAQQCNKFVVNPATGVLTNNCDDSADTNGNPNNQAAAMTLKGAPVTDFCTWDGKCVFPMNSSVEFVGDSIPVNGNPGEDGSNAGGAMVFCRDCSQIDFKGAAGVGGKASTPVSSNLSRKLMCASSNGNALDPQFRLRILQVKPFQAGNSAADGRNGFSGDGLKVYSDLTSEAVFLLSSPDFWLPKTGSQSK